MTLRRPTSSGARAGVLEAAPASRRADVCSSRMFLRTQIRFALFQQTLNYENSVLRQAQMEVSCFMFVIPIRLTLPSYWEVRS